MKVVIEKLKRLFVRTPEEKFLLAWKLMMEACIEGEWGDPFSYARSREIMMAIVLKHKVSKTLSGADGFDLLGNPMEYKSTIDEEIKGTYNGISLKDTWEEQQKYLVEDKIKKYKNHYFARFTNDPVNPIAEMWKVSCDDIYNILEPKLKKQFFNEKNKKKADPRLGASINEKQIKQYGEQIF